MSMHARQASRRRSWTVSAPLVRSRSIELVKLALTEGVLVASTRQQAALITVAWACKGGVSALQEIVAQVTHTAQQTSCA